MMKRLGVLPSTHLFAVFEDYITINQNMKQYYLLYDQLTFGDNEMFLKYLYEMRKYLGTDAKQLIDMRISEYKEMMEKEIAISVLIDDTKIEHTRKIDDLQKYILEFCSPTVKIEDLSFGFKFYNHFPRWKSVLINKQHTEYKALPIDNESIYLNKEGPLPSYQEEILNICLDKFPIVNESISWERIMEFKNNIDSRLKLLRLLNWATDLSKSNYTVQEIKEKIEFLTLEYEESLKLHKLKYSYSTFQTFVLGATEFLENLVHLKLASILKSTLEVKKQKIEMLEEERQLSGNEIAYFIKARNELS